MTGREADALARSVIRQAGYGDAFGHGLGHGVGLNVHEAPRLGPAAGDAPIRAGMVLTIEPGVSLPGRFGVRIEDLAVVREDGVEILSRVTKTSVVSPRALGTEGAPTSACRRLQRRPRRAMRKREDDADDPRR